jgi:hypothetical protein
MDEVTQQNSALVEENAATAKTLEHQANAMNERVDSFRIAGGDMAPAARPAAARAPAAGRPQAPAAKRADKPQLVTAKRAAAGGNGSGPVPRMQAALAQAVNQDADWKEF